MNKVAHYLQEHLVGEVSTSADARRFFATDSSVFTVAPSIVVYPRNENDVRKTARFTWRLAERGRIMPITARGLGTDQGGAALGEGIMMVFPAHMNRIIEFDSKSGEVTVEPGINFGRLQQTLHTHGRFLPPYPASIEYSSIGGAIANNAGGEKSIKYGSTRDFVKALKVVLANGEIIETGRLNKKEFNKKLGLATFEGEIYRAMDKLIEDNQEVIALVHDQLKVSKNSSGYDLWDIRSKDGAFDLTPLFVGSQGTLGIVTEATLDTEPYSPDTTLIAAFFDDLQTASQAVLELRGLSEPPSAIEVVDENLLKFIDDHNPNQLKGIVEKPFHKLIMLIEFDTPNKRLQKKMAKRATRILSHYEVPFDMETEDHLREQLWRIRHSASAVMQYAEGNQKALPIIEDGTVPAERLQDYLEGIYQLFEKFGLRVAVWGHAGNANLHIQPFMDLSQVGDRQKLFRLMDEYYGMVVSMGGSISGEHGDGRLRAPYVRKMYGDEVYELFQRVKQIFDPYNTLNPGVKINVTVDDIKPLLRDEYSVEHLHQHLPRS